MGQNWYKKTLPKSRTEWVIAGGIWLSLATTVVRELFLPPLDLLDSAWASWLTKIAGDVALLIAFTVLIADSIRRIGQNGRSWKNISMLVIGIAVPLAYIFLLIYAHNALSRGTELVLPNDALIEDMARKLEAPDLPPDFRSSLSRLYANELYTYYGKIIHYFTLEGEPVVYQPTDEERDFRDKILEGRKTIQLGKSSMLRGTCVWSAVILVGVFSGFFVLRTLKDRGEP